MMIESLQQERKNLQTALEAVKAENAKNVQDMSSQSQACRLYLPS